MSTSLVPYRPSLPAPGGLALTAGPIGCDVRIVDVDERRLIASCDVSVVNGTDHDLSARIYGLDHEQAIHEYSRVDVSAGGILNSRIALPLARDTAGRVYVEVSGPGVYLRGETVVPMASGRMQSAGLLESLGTWNLVGPLAAVVVLVGGWYLSSSHLILLKIALAPPVSSASMAPSSVVAPANVPAPNRSVARIASLTADIRAGLITVSYLADADQGTVSVIDETGSTIAMGPFSHGGVTQLSVPRTFSGRLQVNLDVQRGSDRARASVGLVATPSVENSTAPSAPVTAGASGVAASLPDSNGTSPLSTDPISYPNPIVAGSSFGISIRRSLANMHVALQDEIGTVIDERDVQPGLRSITLRAPSANTSATGYLVCTFDTTSGQQTLVRAVRINPH